MATRASGTTGPANRALSTQGDADRRHHAIFQLSRDVIDVNYGRVLGPGTPLGG